MKRWNALTGAALVAALVFAPLVSTGANAAEAAPTLGVIGDLQPWSEPTNHVEYWENLYKDHQAVCYSSVGSSSHGDVSADKKTVTLNTFNQDWPGDHWELLVVKSGNLWNNVIEHPTAGVAYASPLNNGDQQGDVSHWIVCKGTTPLPTVVTPNPPVVKDKCETANDHYGLPEETVGVAYTRSGKDIVGTPATGYVFGALPSGWTLNADKSATYAFNPAQFTNLNCEEVVPVPAVFVADPTSPTCESDGALPTLNTYPNVTLSWDRPFNGPGVYTLTATANTGFEFPDGSTVKTQKFTVDGKLSADEEECTPPTTPVPAVFSAAPVAPTCLTEGALPTLGEHPNVALAFDRAYNGPGVYILTATANEGFTFPDGETVKTGSFTVAGKLATQSTDSAAPCYQAPPSDDPVPSDPGTPTALPATGGVDMMPWGMGGAAMLLAGAAALIMTRRFARR